MPMQGTRLVNQRLWRGREAHQSEEACNKPAGLAFVPESGVLLPTRYKLPALDIPLSVVGICTHLPSLHSGPISMPKVLQVATWTAETRSSVVRTSGRDHPDNDMLSDKVFPDQRHMGQPIVHPAVCRNGGAHDR